MSFFTKFKKKNKQSFVKWCRKNNIERIVCLRYLQHDKNNQFITLKEYNEKWNNDTVRLSGYDWHVLHFIMDAECLEVRITDYLKQIKQPHYGDSLPLHYNAAVSDLLVPLLWQKPKYHKLSLQLTTHHIQVQVNCNKYLYNTSIGNGLLIYMDKECPELKDFWYNSPHIYLIKSEYILSFSSIEK